MLELLPIPFPHVVGLRVSGKVNHTDVEQLRESVARKLESEDHLGIYIELEHFQGFTLRGLLREMRFVASFFKRITRTALVGEARWYSRAAQLITHWMPNAEIEHFTDIQRDEALLWVSERDVGAFSG